ncbi:ABC transporter ATP-binding protein [bacterium]|nr:ABC transporter ATP-binding protein [bacterium]
MLDVRDIKVHYAKVRALKGISIYLEKRDFVCLIGANGAGKTTTIKSISGLKKLTSGEIWFKGKRIDHLSPERIAKVGIIQVPEGRRVFSYLTVLENLMVGAHVKKDKKKIASQLERVFQHFPNLVERRKQRAGSLSGGEQQMLAFGRALMADPKLLMMDEPTLGLSPIMVHTIAKFAIDINKEGTTILLVEQNAGLALSIAKRAYVMETGSIVLEGEAQELINSEHVKKAYLGL